MTQSRDWLIALFTAVVRVGSAANAASAVLFLAAIAASVPGAPAIEAQVSAKYGAGLDAAAVLAAMRWLLALGLVAVVAVDRIFASLRGILSSLRDGDPFRLRNADRLRTIGRGLLVLQVLDFGLGGFALLFTRLGVDFVSWSPSFTGWFGVLVAFVLARVFRLGAAMRDDLEGTV